jgi:hypothetical protein
MIDTTRRGWFKLRFILSLALSFSISTQCSAKNGFVLQQSFVYPTKFTKVPRECDVLLDDSLKGKAGEAFEFIK